MTTNTTPTIQPWAIDALRELVDIAGLLNDEMFVAVEGASARATVIDRLTRLSESIALALDDDPQVED